MVSFSYHWRLFYVKNKNLTGFASSQSQFAPNNPSEVLVTSADSRIRIVDGSQVVQKFKGNDDADASFASNIFCYFKNDFVFMPT